MEALDRRSRLMQSVNSCLSRCSVHVRMCTTDLLLFVRPLQMCRCLCLLSLSLPLLLWFAITRDDVSPAALSSGLRGYRRISPGRMEQFLDKHCNQCALISSSGQMLGAGAGEEIDRIGCVIRMNNAPTRGFEEDVGSRTSVRVVSHTSVPLLVKNERYYFQESADTVYIFWGPERNMRQDGKGRIYNVLLKIATKYPNARIYAVTRDKVQYCDSVFQNETGKNRSFPGFFQKEARGKRRFAPYRTKESGKSFLVSFFLLEKQYEKTPKGDEELPLMLAGLGKRSLTIYENMTHSEFSELLVSAYPRLANICGGWMLHKSTGGGGRRSLVVIPPDLHGYTGQQLKAVSGNGRYTMYISPLQEELDTVPLPPEAKEFEKMPKAQCTTCKKMVPLQILPVHIKECKTELVDLSYSAEEENCNEEHEDEFPDSICNQTYKTAECPVCNNAFQVDMIEIHAATCGLRPSDNDGHESSGSVPVGQISSFQSSEEILDWITCQVDETNTFSICVSRTDLFSRGMQQWQRQKKTSPKCRLKVAFFGEAGIDTGALSREFLTEMLSEIENRLFVGGSDKKGKNPVYCLNSLDSNYFRSAGEVMAASLAQGGPCPSFMREWCFRHLCSGDSDTIQVSASDVTDFELSQLIDRINSASNDNISDLVDDVVTCGYTGIVSLENKDSMIRTVVLHSTMRVIPMLDQLRKGLQLYDLPKIMKTHQDLCLPLFVPGEDDEADAAFLLERSRPVFSEIGSANHQKEVNIINFLQDYLQEIEDSGQEGPSNDISPEGLTVGRIMQWMTGQRHKPVLPSEKKDFVINMQFNHGCDTRHTVCFPTVSACSRTVTFPSAHLKTYTEFKNILTLAICHGQTFDRV